MLKKLTYLSRSCSKLTLKRIHYALNVPYCLIFNNLSKIQQRFYSVNDEFDDDFFDKHLKDKKHVVDAEELEEQEYSKFLAASGLGIHRRNSIASDNVLVIHPKIRWGQNSAPSNTTPELQLEEAVTLCKTLPGFNVVRYF